MVCLILSYINPFVIFFFGHLLAWTSMGRHTKTCNTVEIDQQLDGHSLGDLSVIIYAASSAPKAMRSDGRSYFVQSGPAGGRGDDGSHHVPPGWCTCCLVSHIEQAQETDGCLCSAPLFLYLRWNVSKKG